MLSPLLICDIAEEASGFFFSEDFVLEDVPFFLFCIFAIVLTRRSGVTQYSIQPIKSVEKMPMKALKKTISQKT